MTGRSRDRANDGLLTLLGDLPDLVSNLVRAEVGAAKAWLARTAKDAGFSGLWFALALFFLFWLIPVILTFAIIGIASWWPLWLSALTVLVGLLLVVVLCAVCGIVYFRRVTRRENPVQAVAEDVRLVKGMGNDDE